MDRRLSLYGVAITLWLLISSVVMGGILAVFLAIGRVSSNKYIQFPIWLFTYVFRGTPLYVQLLVFYSGMYTLEIVKGTELLNAFFRSGLNCTVLALTLNTCAYTTEIFAGAIRSVPPGEIEAARAYGFSSVKMLSLHYFAVCAAYRAASVQQRSDSDAALHRAGFYCHRAGSAENRQGY
ncbi:Histidine ABC transporter, permease protein HisM (TC 3.A.1.3.1) [Raoultella ornithinolytica]|nr:Histidine ABC transporter, permease protein HisM (TC 3.A.1.3.1) [Raoultella ornithinolytica]